MKKLLTIVLILIASLGFSQTKKKVIKIEANNLFESGSYIISDSDKINFERKLQEKIRKFPITDSLLIDVTIISSTDNIKISDKLKSELVEKGYEPNNMGLSKIRNKYTEDMFIDVVCRNRLSTFINEITNIYKTETGNTKYDRYSKIKISVVKLPKIVIMDDCLDVDDVNFKEQQNEYTNQIYNKGLQNKPIKQYYKLVSNSFENTNKELFVLTHKNPYLKIKRKFNKKLVIGASSFVLGTLSFIQGANLQIVNINEVDKNGNVSETDSTITKNRKNERRVWYITSAVLCGVGTYLIIDAFICKNLSLQVGMPSEMIKLNYKL